jgi:hypothetical protein
MVFGVVVVDDDDDDDDDVVVVVSIELFVLSLLPMSTSLWTHVCYCTGIGSTVCVS